MSISIANFRPHHQLSNTTTSSSIDPAVDELPSVSQTSSFSWKHSLIAGYVAGISGVSIGHPLDSLKVFLQTNKFPHHPSSSLLSAQNIQNVSFPLSSQASSRLTLRMLYAGVSGPLVTVGLIQSINFGLYDTFRRWGHCYVFDGDGTFNPEAYRNDDSILNVACSAMMAGGLLAFVTSPLLIIKTKQQVMTWDVKTALRDTLKPRPSSSFPVLSNFMVGFSPHFLSETLGRGVYFATYEFLKRFVRNHENNLNETVYQRMGAAGMSGILCWSVIFPFDVLRNRLYAQTVVVEGQEGHHLQKSAWRLAKDMYRYEGGWKPFYRGFGITVLRAGPVAAAVLPVYDCTMEWLNQEN
jgi:solute carrier family 25 (mitochondrial carnitine/acylcarnitine transporter), member 20/29